jgi:hypothetical protein
MVTALVYSFVVIKPDAITPLFLALIPAGGCLNRNGVTGVCGGANTVLVLPHLAGAVLETV